MYITVRDLKLAVVTGIYTDEIKSLNQFFTFLFNDLIIYTYHPSNSTDLLFFKNNKCIMVHDLTKSVCIVNYIKFWLILEDTDIPPAPYSESKNIISYKIEENYNYLSLIEPTNALYYTEFENAERLFSLGLLCIYKNN